MTTRLTRVALMLALGLMVLAGLSALTAQSAAADFGCYGDVEEFEEYFYYYSNNPTSSGWSLDCYTAYGGTYGCWEQGSGYAYGGNFSGSQAQSIYGDYQLSTQLYSPSFSTVDYREASVDFDGYFYFYSGYGNVCDLDVSTDGGNSWTEIGTWGTYGNPTHETVDLDAGMMEQPNVMLRWDRYTSSYPYYYAVIDNVQMICALSSAAVDDIPVAVPEDPTEWCEAGIGELTFTVTNTGNRPLEDIAGQPEFYVSLSTDNGAPVSVLSIASGSGGAGQIPGAAPLGGSASANLSIPVGGTDTVVVRLGFPGGLGGIGGLFVERGVWVDINPRDGQVGEGEMFRFLEKDPILVPCAPSVDPNKQLGMQVHLPILNYLGNDDLCETWIEVQAIGANPMKAVLVTWGEPGFCPPQAAGPLKVECTGLLKPGSTWNLMGDQIPSGSKGGMLFKFSTKQLSEVGLDDTFGFDDILADLMCETLFFGVVGDADDFRRFKKAYNEGGNFGGIPQDVAAGWKEGGILAVDVLRDCPSPQAAGVRVTSKYNGIAGSHLGTYDPVYGGYMYYVPLVYADVAEFNSWIYIQNGGLECSSVEIWFKDMEECLRSTICEVSTLAPGETLQIDPNDCVNQFQGSAWIRTSQPMGVVVDITGRDVLMTYIGEPAELNYTFDPTQAIASPGNQVGFAPLIYSEYQGWDSGIQVQNLSPVQAAKVKVYFLDRSGDVITTLMDWICPRGAQTFFLPVVHDLPGNWVGSARVESQEWITPGGPLVQPPNIVAVATLIKYADAQRADTREAIAYNLLPEHKIFDWQIGFGGGGLDSGIGLIAVPSLLNDLDGTGVTSELAIANIVPKPGFTDFAIYLYDQNGLMDYLCQKLNEKQVEYIDLQTWGYIGNGYKGSAVISAVYWEHDVFAGDGRFLRNLVGLGAVAVERSKTMLGTDIAGDEAAGDRGIPFRRSDIEDEEFGYLFGGEYPPLCPGVPSNLRQPPGEGPTCIEPTGEEVQADWGGSRPVPLTYSPGSCNGVNSPQSHALENPDIVWDGTDGDILEFWNCSNGTEEVSFDCAPCPGAAPYGMIIQFYQFEDGAADPATPGGCENLIFCKNPSVGGWCYSNQGGCRYDVEPGIFEVLVQTDLIGGSCQPFSLTYTLEVQ